MGRVVDPETGNIYLRARYYDPNSAQFLTRDPMVAETGSAYGYVDNNPLNATDPTGLIGWSDIGHYGEKVVAWGAGKVAAAGAALASSFESDVVFVNQFGSPILKSFDVRIVTLGGTALAVVGSGVAQAVSDAFRSDLSLLQRVGRVTLAAGTTLAVVGGVALICSSGVGCIALAIAGGLAARYIEQRFNVACKLGLGPGF